MATALKCGDRYLDLGTPQIMGILNVTPDSFSDGGLFISATGNSSEVALNKALDHCKAMVEQGAAIIDIGGESTRPGAQAVSIDEERRRVIPLVTKIRESIPDCLISVDTSKPAIMKDAIEAGAHIINDVTALQNPEALETVAASNVAVCLMHMKGEPRNMQKNPEYRDVVSEVIEFLGARVKACHNAGISPERIIVDPGFGFGKTLSHNLQLFRNMESFKSLGAALLVGVSRKSMIGAILDKPVNERQAGSVGLASLAVWLGADILRVHDVEDTSDALKVVHAVKCSH